MNGYDRDFAAAFYRRSWTRHSLLCNWVAHDWHLVFPSPHDRRAAPGSHYKIPETAISETVPALARTRQQDGPAADHGDRAIAVRAGLRKESTHYRWGLGHGQSRSHSVCA